MARLPYLDKDDLKDDDKDLLARGINLHRLLVHSPGAARAFEKIREVVTRPGGRTDDLGGRGRGPRRLLQLGRIPYHVGGLFPDTAIISVGHAS